MKGCELKTTCLQFIRYYGCLYPILEVHKSEVIVMMNFKITLIIFDMIRMQCCKGKLLHFYGIHVEKS